MFPRLKGAQQPTSSILSTNGGILVSDSSFAHHHMSPKALKDTNLKFSPGLGQDPSIHSQRHASQLRPNQGIRAFQHRGRYEENPGSNNDAKSARRDDDDDDDESLRDRYERQANQKALNAAPRQSAPPPQKQFDIKSLKNVAPKVPRAADAAKHKAGGGDVKIFNQRPHFEVQARINARQNEPKYSPRQSDVVIYSHRQRYKVQPKIPTAASARSYKAHGGDVKIVDAKPQWKAEPKIPTAASAAQHHAGGGDVKIFHQHLSFKDKAAPKVPTAASAAAHKPAGGKDDVFDWKKDPETRHTARPLITHSQLIDKITSGELQQGNKRSHDPLNKSP